jgi:hypothetical protein
MVDRLACQTLPGAGSVVYHPARIVEERSAETLDSPGE